MYSLLINVQILFGILLALVDALLTNVGEEYIRKGKVSRFVFSVFLSGSEAWTFEFPMARLPQKKLSTQIPLILRVLESVLPCQLAHFKA